MRRLQQAQMVVPAQSGQGNLELSFPGLEQVQLVGNLAVAPRGNGNLNRKNAGAANGKVLKNDRSWLGCRVYTRRGSGYRLMCPCSVLLCPLCRQCRLHCKCEGLNPLRFGMLAPDQRGRHSGEARGETPRRRFPAWFFRRRRNRDED